MTVVHVDDLSFVVLLLTVPIVYPQRPRGEHMPHCRIAISPNLACCMGSRQMYRIYSSPSVFSSLSVLSRR